MKNKKLYIVFSMLLIVIILMTVTKEMQNDTFFTIATGEHILQEGYDNVDHLTWHENLGFLNWDGPLMWQLHLFIILSDLQEFMLL